ncbi:unnamed protein product [Cercospora beticola]|nr:unnamed protein product [Cercospora beticola]
MLTMSKLLASLAFFTLALQVTADCTPSNNCCSGTEVDYDYYVGVGSYMQLRHHHEDGCSSFIRADCVDADCCSTVKKHYWKDGVEGDYYYGVPC